MKVEREHIEDWRGSSELVVGEADAITTLDDAIPDFLGLCYTFSLSLISLIFLFPFFLNIFLSLSFGLEFSTLSLSTKYPLTTEGGL